MKLERIVVGVDGSADSLAALAWAAGLATIADAEVVAVHAVGLLEQSRGGELERTLAEEWCAPATAAGVRARRLLRNGSAVPVLLATADEEEADLVVVGSRGVGKRTVHLLGSTSSQISQQANQPVVIVPGTAGRTDHAAHDHVQLDDGRPLEVRPLRSGLHGAVAAFLDGLPPGEVSGRVAHLGDGTTLVATDADGTIAGVGRYWLESGTDATDAADVAVVVAPAFRGAALGRKLLALLGVHAFERGVRRFVATYPAEQQAVTALVTGSGLPHRREEEAGTARVDIDLLPGS